MNSQDRRNAYNRFFLEALMALKPSVGKAYSGQQVAYAKGQATKAMLKAGF